MKNLIAAITVLLATATASAGIPSNMTVENRSAKNHSIWVTTYNNDHDQMENACVPAGQSWTGARTYFLKSYYYIRIEIKEHTNCGGGTYLDTDLLAQGSDRAVLNESIDGTVVYENRGQETIGSSSAITAINQVRSGKSIWFTVRNLMGDISDTGCVRPGGKKIWGGYHGFKFMVSGEIKENADCSGGTIAYDEESTLRDSSAIMKQDDNGTYYLQAH